MPLPEQAMLELDAMDAALRGESVDPEFAEFAELALLLASTRPDVGEDVAYRLDLRVSGLASVPERRTWWRWVTEAVAGHRAGSGSRPVIFRPAFGAGLTAVAALVIVVVLVGTGGGSGARSGADDNASLPAGLSRSVHHGSAAAGAGTATGAGGGSASSGAATSVAEPATQNLSATLTTAKASLPSLKPAAPPPAVSGKIFTPAPVPNGRRIIQSSQLTLTAPGARIATVSEEVFTVVGAEQGIVKHSAVNSGPGASASFTLSIPSSNLSVTLARLAQLHYATVASSTSSTSDVNSQYLDNQRALADAKALRTSLLTQLEAATTTAAIDSLKVQIHDAESTIASDESTVNRLNGKIAYSSVNLQIETGPGEVQPVAHGHGFTLSRAAHDALKVLVAVGGGALIALAVLVPLGIALGLVAWVSLTWRRRRRERVLDAA